MKSLIFTIFLVSISFSSFSNHQIWAQEEDGKSKATTVKTDSTIISPNKPKRTNSKKLYHKINVEVIGFEMEDEEQWN